jgi:hypothetical protein
MEKIQKEPSPARERPFLLTVFCVALFIYSGMLTLIFLLAVVFNHWISHTVDEFFRESTISRNSILALSLVAFLLNGLSFYSVFAVWNLKKHGLYTLAMSSMFFLLFPFFLGFGSVTSLIIMGAVNVILFMFYKQFS